MKFPSEMKFMKIYSEKVRISRWEHGKFSCLIYVDLNKKLLERSLSLSGSHESGQGLAQL